MKKFLFGTVALAALAGPAFAADMRASLALAILAAMTSTALAGGGFDIVVPVRPGVPIIINGVDASYAVVESAMGLARNESMVPTVYGGRPIDPQPNVGHYYPSLGRMNISNG